MYEDNSIWLQKGATLSDKSARQEFGLTQDEIFAASRLPSARHAGRALFVEVLDVAASPLLQEVWQARAGAAAVRLSGRDGGLRTGLGQLRRPPTWLPPSP